MASEDKQIIDDGYETDRMPKTKGYMHEADCPEELMEMKECCEDEDPCEMGMHGGKMMMPRPMMLAHAYVPWQRYVRAFSPREALMKGTLFPELWGVYPIPE